VIAARDQAGSTMGPVCPLLVVAVAALKPVVAKFASGVV
jgi:hypothetical protein